jgi:hypothetical protein
VLTRPQARIPGSVKSGKCRAEGELGGVNKNIITLRKVPLSALKSMKPKHTHKTTRDYLPYPAIYANYWPHHKYDLPINDSGLDIQWRETKDKKGNRKIDCLYGWKSSIAIN